MSCGPTLVRRFRHGEERALHTVFHSAVHGLACRDYTAEQIDAWAPADIDRQAWAARIQAIQPLVVERAGEVIAYADLQPDGYIDHFFVSAPCAGQGVGMMLMAHLHAAAAERSIGQLSSHVSRTAQPFFKRCGFTVAEQRVPVLRGVAVPNALMRKVLTPA